MMSAFRRLELQSQYASLRQPKSCPEGVYVTTSPSLEEWSGVIFIHKGYYRGSVFRFTISFPRSYPLRAPVVHFAKGTLIHPLVDPRDDRLALASGFPRWDAKTDNVSKVLYYIKGIFKDFHLSRLNDGLAVNGEAWRLYQSNRPLFIKLAAQCATMTSSSSTLYAQAPATGLDTANPSDRPTQVDLLFRQISDEELNQVREALYSDEH